MLGVLPVFSLYGLSIVKKSIIFDVKSKQVSRANRVKLRPGTLGLVVTFDHRGVEDYDAHYVVVVGERKLGVPFRFLHKVQT